MIQDQMSEITSKQDFQPWQDRIRGAWQKCAESIIETGRLLNAAKDELEHGSFLEMVRSKLPFGPDTAERLMAIARHPVLSDSAHAPILPPSWMTLYELTKLDAKLGKGTLRRKIKGGQVFPQMERKDVIEMMRTTNEEAERLERKAARETEKAKKQEELSRWQRRYEVSPAATEWAKERLERERKAKDDAEELERPREEKRAAAARAAADVGVTASSEIERKLARLEELEPKVAMLERQKLALEREMVDLVGDPAAVAARLCAALGDRAEIVAKAMLAHVAGKPIAAAFEEAQAR
jgi:hypothetical protein